MTTLIRHRQHKVATASEGPEAAERIEQGKLKHQRKAHFGRSMWMAAGTCLVAGLMITTQAIAAGSTIRFQGAISEPGCETQMQTTNSLPRTECYISEQGVSREVSATSTAEQSWHTLDGERLTGGEGQIMQYLQQSPGYMRLTYR
ncbi:hypothetical protein QWY79_05030 [Halomonas sabkhae]|uniref:hypothetical protein n=1 Tax=Halomonas sabkhae TaxID=626223 RepID=UPI0025B4E3BA|nr:hypothetical protein [Halomonas sabkhae]MDN3524627.1 hypothetical protein [Halomonas sabkhae]